MPTILIVDDEADIRQLLRLYLQNDGYELLEASNGEEALQYVETHPIDLMLLDVMMPKRDGFSTVQAVRQAGHTFPVLMLTAKQEDLDKIQGLTFGADDYIGKPFNPLEVLARIKAMLRRVQQYHPPVAASALQVGPFTLRADERLILKHHTPLALTRREFDVFALLLTHPKRVFPAEELYERIWQEEALGSATNAVMVLMHKLREKVEDSPKQPRHLQTVWGVGYKVEP
ncbi:MAG: response regulator transcription factor [Exiguobacterium oxidotolerans]|uniref:DNA-binding response regulator n=1 Tax=Exiguobacterium oxidotolerans TaxID=223958 RepID=A0A653IG48_9BACL|nr:response regulator transcription factor [Exiguobacterium oxidotolerans]VWX38250.1 conserved hypothetical protein [Exiguobacterium oxidotolerans]